jgi:hypothetical protein
MPAPHDLTSIDQVFDLWSTQVEMARDVGVQWQACAKWSQRKRIPPEAWDAVIAAVKRKGRRLSPAQLNKLNTPRKTARQVAATAGDSSRA